MATAKAYFPEQRFELSLVRPNPKFKKLLDKALADLNKTKGTAMFDTIEAVNDHIATKTEGMTKSEPQAQFGATVTTYAKAIPETDGDLVDLIEVTVYEAGTPIDSEHAELIDEAPDMATLLHGAVDDLTTVRVVMLNLADGVDGDEVQTEAERNWVGVGVAEFAQEILDKNPEAAKTFIATNDPGNEVIEGNGTIEGKDASTHQFDGVVSDTVVDATTEAVLGSGLGMATTFDSNPAAEHARLPEEQRVDDSEPLDDGPEKDGAN